MQKGEFADLDRHESSDHRRSHTVAPHALKLDCISVGAAI
jgi:hypothetical protein